MKADPIINARQRSCGKVMFSQASVSNSVHGGWEWVLDSLPEVVTHLPGVGIQPPAHRIHRLEVYGQDTVDKRAVRILLEYFLV